MVSVRSSRSTTERRVTRVNEKLSAACYFKSMSNLSTRSVGGIFVLVGNSTTPSQAEWDTYMAQLKLAIEAREGKPLGLVVFTAGGTPDSGMRLQLRQTIGTSVVRTAIVTESMVVRSVVGIISIFINHTRPFAPLDWRSALEHVGFDFANLPVLKAALQEMDANVGGSAPVRPFLAQ